MTTAKGVDTAATTRYWTQHNREVWSRSSFNVLIRSHCSCGSSLAQRISSSLSSGLSNPFKYKSPRRGSNVRHTNIDVPHSLRIRVRPYKGDRRGKEQCQQPTPEDESRRPSQKIRSVFEASLHDGIDFALHEFTP